MIEFQIKENDADQRLDKFILKTMNSLPKSLMYKYIRNKKIKVNRKRCEISQRLQIGDIVQCYIPEEFYPAKEELSFLKVKSNLDIIYEDDNILIVNKPKGLLAHKDTLDVQDNLLDRILHYLYDTKAYDPNKEHSFTPALCHRIDRNTQGLVIAAKNAAALRCMNEKIKLREVEKRYLCVVEGKLSKKKDHLALYHHKHKDNIAQISVTEKPSYQRMETSYQVLQEGKRYSLVEVLLHSGKSHQIRAMMGWLHHPLYGDVKYGANKTKEKNYQALCAYKINFHFSDEECCLSYLNHKEIQLPDNEMEKLFLSLENQ